MSQHLFAEVLLGRDQVLFLLCQALLWLDRLAHNVLKVSILLPKYYEQYPLCNSTKDDILTTTSIGQHHWKHLNCSSLVVPTFTNLGGVSTLDLQLVARLNIFISDYHIFVAIISKRTLEFMMNSHFVVLQKSILASWLALNVWLVIVQASSIAAEQFFSCV